jgi:RNA polymerase sigma-70 factor, ECF subfamily
MTKNGRFLSQTPARFRLLGRGEERGRGPDYDEEPTMLALQATGQMTPEQSMASTELHCESLLAHRDAAYSLALRISSNRLNAEDIVQDAYVRALRFKGEFPSGREQRMWFLCIVRTAALDYSTREQRLKKRELQSTTMAAAKVTSPSTERSLRDLRDVLDSALAALDENIRLPLALHYEQGLTYAEAAAVAGVAEPTIRKQASRGIKALREILARHGFVVSADMLLATLCSAATVKAPPELALAVAKIVSTDGMVKPGVSAAGMSLMLKLAASAAVIAAAAVYIHQPAAETGDPKEEKKPSAAAAISNDTIDPELAAQLERKIDVDYRRTYLGQVAADLRNYKLALHYPWPIDRSFVFTLQQKQITIRQVLEKLAAAGSLKVEFRGKDVVLSQPADPNAWNELQKKLSAGDKQARAEAVYDLSLLGDSRIYPLLVKALSDKDKGIVQFSVSALLWHMHLNKYVALPDGAVWMKLYTSAVSAKFKEMITLLMPEDENCIKELCRTAKRDGGDLYATFQRLGQTKNQLAIDTMIALAKDPDYKSRRHVLGPLGGTRDPRAIKTLIALLDDRDEEIRYQAMAGLLRAEDISALDAVLVHLGDPKIALIASGYLAICDDKRATAALLQMVREGRFGAIYHLSRCKDPEALQYLETLARNPDVSKREQAAQVCVQWGLKGCTDILIQLARDPASKVRLAAANALGSHTTDIRAANCLLELTKDTDSEVSITAKGSSIWLLDERFFRMKVDALKRHPARVNNGHDVTGYALWPECVDEIIELTRDTNPLVRQAIARGMTDYFYSTLPSPLRQRRVGILTSLMTDKDSGVVAAAINSLAQMPDPRALTMIRKLAAHQHTGVRLAVAGVLRSYAGPDVLPDLLALLKDSDARVRTTAERSLAEIDDPAARKALEEFNNVKAAPAVPNNAGDF